MIYHKIRLGTSWSSIKGINSHLDRRLWAQICQISSKSIAAWYNNISLFPRVMPVVVAVEVAVLSTIQSFWVGHLTRSMLILTLFLLEYNSSFSRLRLIIMEACQASHKIKIIKSYKKETLNIIHHKLDFLIRIII